MKSRLNMTGRMRSKEFETQSQTTLKDSGTSV